jgi:hypothetical protein
MRTHQFVACLILAFTVGGCDPVREAALDEATHQPGQPEPAASSPSTVADTASTTQSPASLTPALARDLIIAAGALKSCSNSTTIMRHGQEGGLSGSYNATVGEALDLFNWGEETFKPPLYELVASERTPMAPSRGWTVAINQDQVFKRKAPLEQPEEPAEEKSLEDLIGDASAQTTRSLPGAQGTADEVSFWAYNSQTSDGRLVRAEVRISFCAIVPADITILDVDLTNGNQFTTVVVEQPVKFTELAMEARDEQLLLLPPLPGPTTRKMRFQNYDVGGWRLLAS